MWEYKPVVILINTQLSIIQIRYKATNTLQTKYQLALGFLIYAMLDTWSDITYLVFAISLYTFNLDPGH